ncbi:hypothetical protein GOBAR_DD05407 [Gossypium barbadense]|nr:hypothetical protein GOBAR_DD05407 [Gossypium barbadense]
MSVEAVKDKVWKKCGTSVNSMRLELYDDCKNKLRDLSDDSRPLGFCSPLGGFRIHIIDLDPSSVTSGGWLEDTSLVEKYSISEDEYNKRSGLQKRVKGTRYFQCPPLCGAMVRPDKVKLWMGHGKVIGRIKDGINVVHVGAKSAKVV